MRWRWAPIQLKTFAASGACDILAQLGGRGGTKSTTSFGLLLRTVQHCPGSRSLFLRTTDSALIEPWAKFKHFLRRNGVQFSANDQTGEIKIGTSVVVFGVCESEAYWERSFRGHEFVTIVVSEFASFTDPAIPLKFLSNLRSPDFKTLYVIESNPGPTGYWLEKVLLIPARRLPAGTPFQVPELAGKTAVVIFSTLDSNPFINHAEYERSLRAACGSDAEYERERHGNFGALAGALFDVRRANLVRIPPFDLVRFPHVQCFIAGDHGSASPFAFGVYLRFRESGLGPDGAHYAAGSYIICGEATSADPASAYVKAAYTASVADIGRAIRDECARLALRSVPTVYVDDQIGQRHGQITLLDEYRNFLPTRLAGKGRVVTGVQRIRELLPHTQTQAQLGVRLFGAQPDIHATPALYIDPTQAPYLFHCLTNITADVRDPDAPDPRSKLRHGMDAIAYGLCAHHTTAGAPRASVEYPFDTPPRDPGIVDAALQARRDAELRKYAGRGAWQAGVLRR